MSITEKPITEIKGISAKRAELFKKLGVSDIGGLCSFFPKSYIDYTSPVTIKETEVGETAVFRAEVTKKLKPFIGRVSIYRAVLSDGENEILCVLFNSEYSFNRLLTGKEYIFYGKITGNVLMRELASPLFIDADNVNKIIPKYRLTAGLSQGIISGAVKKSLDIYASGDEPEPLPPAILEEYNLYGKKEALRLVHFPSSMEECKAAKKRLAFEELLTLQFGLTVLKNRNRKLTGAVMNKKDIKMDGFYSALPFTPTNAQIRAVNDCISDMRRLIPMNRLLQGDVGSGKTMVAAAVCYFAQRNGYQSAVMAPTEILAFQHYETFKKFLTPYGLKCALLTGSVSASEKKEMKASIKSGETDIIIGTHALIQKDTEFCRLGFVVTDEQHRFGVKQRSSLLAKGNNPHTLVMSATPIPRTLALIIYGDLDISIIDEMPKGRIPIKTYGVDTGFRERLYKFIIKEVKAGRQAYIVCPIIEEGVSGKTAADTYFEELQGSWFRGIPTGLLHGRMKAAEKDAVMGLFKENKVKILISTTVIEVGVDIPNASVMLIENAEQFGLSQLHQLRGRVGRGNAQAYCILVTDSKTGYTKARIDIMKKTANGFEIANEDLKLRGPGNFFGHEQHGLPQTGIESLYGKDDGENLIEITGALAKKIFAEDENLLKPENAGLKKSVGRLFGKSDEYGFN